MSSWVTHRVLNQLPLCSSQWPSYWLQTDVIEVVTIPSTCLWGERTLIKYLSFHVSFKDAVSVSRQRLFKIHFQRIVSKINKIHCLYLDKKNEKIIVLVNLIKTFTHKGKTCLDLLLWKVTILIGWRLRKRNHILEKNATFQPSNICVLGESMTNTK